MIRHLLIAVLVAVVIGVCAYGAAFAVVCEPSWPLHCPEMSRFGPFYGERLRGSLFAGFLTLGGFLLSLKTFIVVNMKKEVFDTDEYKDNWEQSKKNDKRGLMEKRFEPLRYLSQTLFLAIASCVFTAILQLTLGLAETWWAASICVLSCVLSLIFLGHSLWLIRVNLNRMFEFLDGKDESSDEPGSSATTGQEERQAGSHVDLRY